MSAVLYFGFSGCGSRPRLSVAIFVSEPLKMDSATSPILLPIFIASALSSSLMSSQLAFGFLSLQNAARHFEMPTHEQLNSPTIHFSWEEGVPGGDALMKSDVHQSGIGSLPSPRAGIPLSMSSPRKPLVRFANFLSSGP